LVEVKEKRGKVRDVDLVGKQKVKGKAKASQKKPS
jgi:hypothetical protein